MGIVAGLEAHWISLFAWKRAISWWKDPIPFATRRINVSRLLCESSWKRFCSSSSVIRSNTVCHPRTHLRILLLLLLQNTPVHGLPRNIRPKCTRNCCVKAPHRIASVAPSTRIGAEGLLHTGTSQRPYQTNAGMCHGYCIVQCTGFFCRRN